MYIVIYNLYQKKHLSFRDTMIGFTSLEKFILNLGYSLIKYCIEEVCLNIEMGETRPIFLIFFGILKRYA